jgi:FlaA1/EpsC-like NDP-sugar epimerase
MILFNNRYISKYKILILVIDTGLLLGAVAIGNFLRFGWKEPLELFRYFLPRGVFFGLVFQISLYYFELYDLKTIRDASKFGPRFIQSIAVTLIVLMTSYYILPNLYLGRGVLLFTVTCATAAVLIWRIIYRSLVTGNQLNERIIILGTGEFAREIAREIRDRRDCGFQIIGHIDGQTNTRRIKNDKHAA